MKFSHASVSEILNEIKSLKRHDLGGTCKLLHCSKFIILFCAVYKHSERITYNSEFV